jgi:hypothetical protein
MQAVLDDAVAAYEAEQFWRALDASYDRLAGDTSGEDERDLQGFVDAAHRCR